MRVYGSKVSYFTGKLEVFLRHRETAYELLPLIPHEREVRAQTGTTQMPAVELASGRWMSDTTPILHHLDAQTEGPSIYPPEPALRFLALLIEDYADEWLWRPAMHYRWSHAHDRELLSSILADEQVPHIPLPRFVKRRMIQRRQLGGFVRGDGVNDVTRAHVERGYFAALEHMGRLLEDRRFLLGDTPSVADIGLMGPMLRHFGQDPTPAELMRTRAPAVHAWVARVWNTRVAADAPEPTWIDAGAPEVQPLLREICETHLVQLAGNAEAFRRGARRFELRVQGCPYTRLPVSRYRVWCLEELRREFDQLDPPTRKALRELLAFPEAEVLWRQDLELGSDYDPERRAPFNRAINVYGKGVPR